MHGDVNDPGADLQISDREHTATPLGWACFGADYVSAASGDYVDTVTALLQAGAHHSAGDHEPAHAGVRAALGL